MAKKRLINFYKGEKRSYEVSFILNHTLSTEALKEKIEALKKLAQEEFNAEIKHIAQTGLKSYCYPINSTNNKRGYYGLLLIELKPENVSELLRKISIQDDVLRALIVLADPKKQNYGVFSNNYEEESQKTRNKVISYDDPNALIRFLGERGKIEPRKQSVGKKILKGIAIKQRIISKQIKIARFLSLLPYVEE